MSLNCPDDGTPLETVEDYVGGGSHYWVYRCPECRKQYYFDTYSFELRHD